MGWPRSIGTPAELSLLLVDSWAFEAFFLSCFGPFLLELWILARAHESTKHSSVVLADQSWDGSGRGSATKSCWKRSPRSLIALLMSSLNKWPRIWPMTISCWIGSLYSVYLIRCSTVLGKMCRSQYCKRLSFDECWLLLFSSSGSPTKYVFFCWTYSQSFTMLWLLEVLVRRTMSLSKSICC